MQKCYVIVFIKSYINCHGNAKDAHKLKFVRSKAGVNQDIVGLLLKLQLWEKMIEKQTIEKDWAEVTTIKRLEKI